MVIICIVYKIKCCMYQTPPFTEYSPYFIIQHNVQYFTGGYSIKTAEVAYYDKTYSREIKMGC